MKPRTILHRVSLALLFAVSAANQPVRTLPVEGRGGDLDLAEFDSEPGANHETKMVAAAGGASHGASHGGHGKYFQDFYSLQYGPRQLEFGHVCEDPDEWEQRFERKDLDKDHHQGQVPSSMPAILSRGGQYGHHDGKDHYENGFRRGNEHHFHERHEKAAPKHGHFTTKVRWGDKHGGYGEHYWDYNHGGHHHDGGGGGDGGGEGSAPVPEVADHQHEEAVIRPHFKRQSAAYAPGHVADLDEGASVAGTTSVSPQGATGGDSGATATATGADGGAGLSPQSPPRRNRAYRKKYVRPVTTTPIAPTHPMPRPRTTAKSPPLSQPRQQQHNSGPSAPPKKSASSRLHAPFLGANSEFPSGSMYQQQQQQQQQSGLVGPRTAREAAAKQGMRSEAIGMVRRLAFDPRTGRVHDEDTGQVFMLQPVN